MFLVPIFKESTIAYINFYNSSIKKTIDKDYCIVSLDNKLIIISYFIKNNQNQNNLCKINFIASSSDLLFDLMNKHKLLVQSISLSHSLYIGKEIYKAELSEIFCQSYIQS